MKFSDIISRSDQYLVAQARADLAVNADMAWARTMRLFYWRGM